MQRQGSLTAGGCVSRSACCTGGGSPRENENLRVVENRMNGMSGLGRVGRQARGDLDRILVSWGRDLEMEAEEVMLF
jgi:hypothetical protein